MSTEANKERVLSKDSEGDPLIFETQINYLKKFPNIEVLGSYVNEFDDNKDFRKIYAEFASRLLKEYDDIIKDEKKRKDLDKKAAESESLNKIKFEEELAKKKQKENEAEEKRIAKFGLIFSELKSFMLSIHR